MTQHLPVPNFYNANNAADWGYDPQMAEVFKAASEWKKTYGLRPSFTDRIKIHLLLIDMQRDFSHLEGTLFVGGRSGTGAIDDSKRVAEFIYRNLGFISSITTTLDTHFAFQIFFPSFWVDKNGAPATAHSVITVDDIKKGNFKPNPAVAGLICNGNYTWLLAQVRHYCEELEKAGKYTLYLWPEHCLLGSVGHSLVGVIHEARMFHAYARSAQSDSEVKGGHPLTENYSVFRPEVMTRHDGRALGVQKNTRFIKTLMENDIVVIGGQAGSHCVKSSIDDLLDEIMASDPLLAKKVYILRDCMSAVTVPDGSGGFIADFTPEMEAALQRFSDAGMNVVSSVDDIADWPGMPIL